MKRSSRSVYASSLVLLSGFAAAFAMYFGGAASPEAADAQPSTVSGAGGSSEVLPVPTDGFMIAGEVSRQLVPGRVIRMNLRLTNALRVDLAVTRLAVRITQVAKADRTSTCLPSDFVVRPATFASALPLDARTNGSLRVLGLHPARWPRIGLLNLPVNQDDCKGVTLTLSFVGSARPVRL
jgi:hypothetical protein